MLFSCFSKLRRIVVHLLKKENYQFLVFSLPVLRLWQGQHSA
ncbi:hypothetical protein BN134_255 [Cronobacter dublinensis 1210]|uniref:Uncharacterized protein n=1 Tax=Cronobacter dublinensis 1210 TaxID=1208656 RepID=A0ABM9Q2J6_9ENTR|nr:hypothetical protein BN134_255 [Cronobacter dublinensis 1210]